MRLTVTTDLTGTITRQELTSMWSDAVTGTIEPSDLDASFNDIFVATSWSDVSASLPNPDPGQLVFLEDPGIMYGFHDVMDVLDGGTDNTAISLWLAIGPDSFETACLAAEPIPAGAVVQPWFDRWVHVFAPGTGATGFADTSSAAHPAPLGINQSGVPIEYAPTLTYGTTAESGTWIRVCIDGYGRGWHPAPDPGVSENHFYIAVNTNHFNLGGCPPHGSPYRGAIIGRVNNADFAGEYTVAKTIHNVTVPSGYTAAYPFFHWLGAGVQNRNLES